MKKVYIDTLGCQMNKSDTERILAILSHFDYIETKEAKEADFLLVNTCSIRKLSEDKAYSQIGVWSKWKKTRPNLKIGICGCLPQHSDENLLKRFPMLDIVFGTQNIYELPTLLKSKERICAIRQKAVEESDYGFIRAKGVNAWLPIMEGCNNFCSYCIVPFTRGRERSRTPETILKEAKEIIKAGYKEITLLGQNVDSYGKNLEDKPTLAYLLREINKIEGDFRVRFVTSYPTDITEELIETVKNCDKICEYFHIPMQAGNDEILKKMNRRYTRAQYGEIVKKIRENVPDVTITSDFIVAFPSETTAQFEDTLSAIDEFELDYSNLAVYSPRPHTKASKMVEDFIPKEEGDRRFQILNNKVKQAHLKSNQKFVGKTMRVLIEDKKDGTLKGRSRNNKIVHFKAENADIGDFIDVKITKADFWHLKGETV